jgi:hypothetical protein
MYAVDGFSQASTRVWTDAYVTVKFFCLERTISYHAVLQSIASVFVSSFLNPGVHNDVPQ